MRDGSESPLRSGSPGTRDLVIGAGVKIVGDVQAPEGVHLLGVVEGDLNAGEVLIGETGSVNGSLTARSADIFGQVSKEAEVTESIILRSTARLTGNLRYRSIQIEAGAKLDCTMRLLEAPAPTKSVPGSSSSASPRPTPPAPGATPPVGAGGVAVADAAQKATVTTTESPSSAPKPPSSGAPTRPEGSR
jgi:cytoskeletal protein CcmA (bactofilin family)